jgi:hypothetical protein
VSSGVRNLAFASLHGVQRRRSLAQFCSADSGRSSKEVVTVVEKRKRGPVPVGVAGVLQPKIFGFPVDRKVLFSNHKSVYKKNIENRQRKLIIKIPFLKPFVRPDEKVLLVTTGHSPIHLLDRLLVGWLFVYLKRSFFVFTDQRIFHVPTTPSYKYRNAIAEIVYGDCRVIRMKGRTLVVEYKKTGSVEKFFSVSGKEKKKIGEILKHISLEGTAEPREGRTSLCPRCAAPLTAGRYQCANCELKFKTRTWATLLALLLPGGGYYYARQYFLGAVTTLIELVLAGTMAISVNDLLNGLGTGVLSLAIAAGLYLLVKTVAVIHSRTFTEDFIPTKLDVDFEPASAVLN